MKQVKPKILIADDVPENIDVLMGSLGGEYAIIAAKDGEKALALARQEPRPDLILLDVMMPRMDGYEVCRLLKADPATAAIPVLFITALDSYEEESKGLALGALDYIAKPFQPDLVKARVANHLELKRHRDHLEELVADRTRELTLTRDVTIFTLANLAEARDPETGGHIRRTQTYVRLLAEKLAELPRFASILDTRAIELLYKTAPLHDVGKVGVPDAILLKPGKLTDEEFEEIKKHTSYGRDALAGGVRELGESSFLGYAMEIAYSHHEKWDGSGYPLGIKGEEIPLSGRLMALADVYDALISKRVYKPPFPHAKAVAIIKDGRGTHFDPLLVDTFFEIAESFRQTALKFADFEEERIILAKE
ncbi:MAG: two-component system response regulator [Desulfobulbaceae bacterium]|nr:two-component system response regulator [Desulfobulbaceae bacterium]HIJ90449.1 two-component system response regulator [Deltaproteobacteria bacterium]